MNVSRLVLAGWLFGLALVTVAPANAEIGKTRPGSTSTDPESLPPPKRTDFHSPQHFAFEVKFGPYRPEIDSAPGVGSPYAAIFGSVGERSDGTRYLKQPKLGLFTEIEFDYQFWRKIGSLAVGLNAGFFRASAKGFNFVESGGLVSCDPVTSPMPCERSGDSTALNVFPIALLAVYRFDLLAVRWKVPLVPYVKIGLGYAFWWIESGGGALDLASATIDGQRKNGRGGSWGWTARPGLAFQLDVIDPPTARNMDAELGINHAYIFAELNYMDYSGFGAKNKMRLSDLTYSIGLAFEF